MTEVPESTATQPNRGWIKLVVLGVVAVAMAAGFYFLKDELSLANLAKRETGLRELQQEHPILVYGVAFCVYVAVTGLSIPGAAGLTLVYGWYFGLVPGTVMVSLASTTGATVAFLLSRYLFRDAIQSKFGDRLASFNRALQREGAFYLFTLRLIPAIPFFVINVVMGLTPMRVPTYWWVSQLGMLPGTIAYVFAGSTIPDLNTLAEKGVAGIISLPLVIAFAILGVFPLLVKKIMERFRKTPLTPDGATDDKVTSLRDAAEDPNPYRPPS